MDVGRLLLAIAFAALLLWLGFAFLRALARSGAHEQVQAEDVADLDVYFVCGECGTELRVEKVGELQVPRHCGEPMHVERRPRGAPAAS